MLAPQPTLTFWRRSPSWVRRPVVVLTFALLYALSCAQFTDAQNLKLSTEKPSAGESLEVTGRDLTPGAQVTARLTLPGGQVVRESAQVGDGGRFSLSLTLPTGGRYQLVVRGPGAERTWQLAVPKPLPKPPVTQTKPNELPARTGQSLTPPTGSAPKGALQFVRTETGLRAAQGGEPLWELTFPEGSGSTTQPLIVRSTSGTADELYLGHGNSVLRLEAQTGNVSARFIVSGPVARLEEIDNETVGVTVRHAQGVLERFTLKNGALQEPVRFGTDPRTFGYLRAEADFPNEAAATLAARLRRDPTNPWLYLKLGLERNPETAQRAFQRAVDAGTTFYDLAGLATVLERRGERTLAAAAFDKGMKNFAARGYDPRLLTDGRLEAAYNFPVEPLKRALRANDDLSAGFWAGRLWLAAPQVPGAADAWAGYAALLRRVGTPDAAALWEARAALKISPNGGILEHLGLRVARSGWKLVPALLAAFFALHLTLLAKYARARRRDSQGNHLSGRLPWLFALRYDTFVEKFVLLSLLALVLICAALGSWAARGEPPAQIIGSGTLANRTAQAYLNDGVNDDGVNRALRGPRAAFVRGTAAQLLGESGKAAALLRAAGNYAPALNNLGVLTGSRALYEQALDLSPKLPAARYNTGDTSLLPFQARYIPNRPALALPTPDDFRVASGSWQGALVSAFTSPQRALSTLPYGFSLLLWRTLQLLFLLIALIHIGFLLVPRPRSAHGAPRGWAYTLLALLFPGTGLADELWGIFLLVPWAVLGASALPFGLVPLGLSPVTLYIVLAGIYLLNTVAVVVEGWSYRLEQRTLELRRSRP